ncbi:hypothetical protein NKH57_02120 [Mesorhizobium sp. M1050]
MVAVAALIVGSAHGAQAHSLEELDAMLQGDEKYFQTIEWNLSDGCGGAD